MATKPQELATIITQKNISENISPEEFEHRLLEMARCKRDIVYFAEKYFRIVSIDKGLHVISLYPKERDLLRSIVNNDRNIVLACRQCGKCVTGDSKVTIRNKHTGIIETVDIATLYSKTS